MMDDLESLPSAIECEKYILAGLLSGSSPDQTADLAPSDFTLELHRRIFGAIQALSADGSSQITSTLVATHLYASNHLPADGLSYIASIGDGVPVDVDLSPYVREVRDCARRVSVMRQLRAMQITAADRTVPLHQILTSASKLADGLSGDTETDAKTITAIVEAIGVDRLIYGEASNGIEPGFAGFRSILRHWRPGEVSILAAKPGWGKTALGLQIAAQVASNGATTVVASKEMTTAELVRRLLAQESRTNQRRWEEADQDTRRTLAESLARLASLDLHIADRAGMEMGEVTRMVAALGRERPVRFLVIDYLQLFTGTGRSNSRNDVLGEVSRQVKLLAQCRELHVLLLCQLSREADKAWLNGQPPNLSMLRDSGEIEQNADNVIFIWPDRSQMDAARTELISTAIKCDIIIAKQRNGATGQFPLDFVRHHTRFVDREEM